MNGQRTLAGLLVATIFLFAGCSSSALAPAAPTVPAQTSPTASTSSPDPGGATTRTSEGGQVTAVIDWAGPADGAVFDVQLDTHAVDLDALTLSDAVLRNDRSETMPAQSWTAPAGGHHREGKLTFGGDPAPFLASAKWVELVLKGVGDLPERTLRWELGA